MGALVAGDAEVPEVDEFGGSLARGQEFGEFGLQGLPFNFTGSAEAGGDAVEIAVVVAGVADELEGAGGWEGVEELRQSGGSEVAGGGDGDGGVGGEHGAAEGLGAAELRVGVEAAFERAEEFDLEPAKERAGAEREGQI